MKKLCLFPDVSIDRQFTEVVDESNRTAATIPVITPVAVNAACIDLPTAITLTNQLRGALIANGICI